MEKPHGSINDSYHSVNPAWQNMVKKNTDSLKHISRTSSEIMFLVKIGLLAHKWTTFFFRFCLTNGLKSDKTLVIHISRGTCTRGDIGIRISFAQYTRQDVDIYRNIDHQKAKKLKKKQRKK